MAERSKLVAGGTHKGFSTHPATFITHTVPVIHDNTIVVAAASPTLQSGDQTKDGWFLSDFYAFNYLLRGAVVDQTWLTAADPVKLLSRWGDYLFGSSKDDRKVVLSHDLLARSEITPVTLIQATEMIDRFLNEIRAASSRAKRSNCPLLIMVFCHGIQNHHLLLDNGCQHKGLSIVRLKEALEPGVAVTLFTTACFSGGWAVTPDLNLTAMTAATPDDESLAWGLSASMGRACGSVFAGATITALSDETTPLIAAQQRKQADENLQPINATNVQTETYNQFCCTITRVLGVQGISDIMGNDFSFSAQDDQWEYSWTRRSGMPLAYFKERWERLDIYSAPPGAAVNQEESAEHLTGSPDATEACIDHMTSMMVHWRVRGMAQLFSELCPGDWNRGFDVGVAGQLFQYLHDGPEAPSPYEIANIIYFRWDTCLLVDRFVDDYGLRRPNDEICIMWHRDEYYLAKRQQPGYKEWNERVSQVWNALIGGGASISPANDQGPPFYRPLMYIRCAIADSFTTWNEAAKAVEAYCNFVASVRQFYLDKALAAPDVRRSGRQWLKSIGRRIRRSLSPSKTHRSSLSEGIERLEIGETSTEPLGKKLGTVPTIPCPADGRHHDEEEA